jgi:uroporphyrinogen-III decarboxylase
MERAIEIAVPVEEIEERRQRVERAKRFEPADRVPVIPAINYRFLLPQIGVRFADYFSDPETMLRSQILGQKWLLEHVRTDQHSIAGAWVGAWTDFQNTSEASALGCEVVFPPDDIPWVKGGWVRTDRDLRRLEAIDVARNGLHGKAIEYRRAMMAVAEKYPVRFLGGPVFHPGASPVFTHTSHGPFTNAGALLGHEEAFAAVKERPDFLREVLEIVTGKIIEYLDFCWEELRLPRRDFAWTDDLAAGLSDEDYRDIVLPYEKRLRFHFDGWTSLHMCGRTDHLLRTFADDLRIDEYQGFGWEVDLDRVAEVMGGRVVLDGNVSPVLIWRGNPEEVRAAARRVIEKLGPLGGLILQDGNNIAPGSPLENINAMHEAALEIGPVYQGRKFTTEYGRTDDDRQKEKNDGSMTAHG